MATTLLFVAAVFIGEQDSDRLTLKLASCAGPALAVFMVASSLGLAAAERGGLTFAVLTLGGLAALAETIGALGPFAPPAGPFLVLRILFGGAWAAAASGLCVQFAKDPYLQAS